MGYTEILSAIALHLTGHDGDLSHAYIIRSLHDALRVAPDSMLASQLKTLGWDGIALPARVDLAELYDLLAGLGANRKC